MNEPTQQVWVIPPNSEDMAPLPALKQGEHYALYDRKAKSFGPMGVTRFVIANCYETFDECRAAMMKHRTEGLEHYRAHVRQLASSIEHIRTIPTAPFPDVIREVSEAQQEEAQGQEEAQAEEVKPAIKRPPIRRGR